MSWREIVVLIGLVLITGVVLNPILTSEIERYCQEDGCCNIDTCSLTFNPSMWDFWDWVFMIGLILVMIPFIIINYPSNPWGGV